MSQAPWPEVPPPGGVSTVRDNHGDKDNNAKDDHNNGTSDSNGNSGKTDKRW